MLNVDFDLADVDIPEGGEYVGVAASEGQGLHRQLQVEQFQLLDR